jgi:hypothetical protein
MAGADGGEVAYLELFDFHQAAVEALGVDIETARRVANATLAGSALGAPAAGFGDVEKYPDFATKVAVLLQAIRATMHYRMGTSARHCFAPSFSPGSTGSLGAPARRRTRRSRNRPDRRGCPQPAKFHRRI